MQEVLQYLFLLMCFVFVSFFVSLFSFIFHTFYCIVSQISDQLLTLFAFPASHISHIKFCLRYFLHLIYHTLTSASNSVTSQITVYPVFLLFSLLPHFHSYLALTEESHTLPIYDFLADLVLPVAFLFCDTGIHQFPVP